MDVNKLKIGVVGAGTIGHGITQLAATDYHPVIMVDIDSNQLQVARNRIEASLGKLHSKGRLPAGEDPASILARITITTEFAALKPVDFIFESTPERIGVKHEALKAIQDVTPTHIPIATTTSSLLVRDIGAVLGNKTRFLAMHPFNPVVLMPLIEIARAEFTCDYAVDMATALAKEWGKTVIPVKDSPGFVGNRVARGFYLVPLRMLGFGVADVKTIDEAMRQLGNFKMGPFQLMDLIGLDTNLTVTHSIHQALKSARFESHPIQESLVEQNRLGRKAEKGGFYTYDEKRKIISVSYVAPAEQPEFSLISPAVDEFVEHAALTDSSTIETLSPEQRYVFAATMAMIMNEAALLLDDDIASQENIDLAMEKGFNYPPGRGPLAWAESTGWGFVRGVLKFLNGQHTSQYALARLFQVSLP